MNKQEKSLQSTAIYSISVFSDIANVLIGIIWLESIYILLNIYPHK